MLRHQLRRGWPALRKGQQLALQSELLSHQLNSDHSCRAIVGPAPTLTLVLLHQPRSDVIAVQGGCRADAGAISSVGRL